MSKISELVPDEMLGKVKVRQQTWWPHEYFTPYYKDTANRYYGLDQVRRAVDFNNGNTNFELFVEPKPKVKRWLWVFKGDTGTQNQAYIDAFYYTEQEAKNSCEAGRMLFDKCKWSEKEFPE